MATLVLACIAGAATGEDHDGALPDDRIVPVPAEPEAPPPVEFDTVVVTATRREQLQRNVPLAITTLTGEKLKEMGATRFDEYAPVVPGLSFTNCGCTPGEKYTFRGIATDGIKSSLRPLTAVYFGETPVTYANGISTIAYSADPDLVDIDRVEVLRGPQGTLYGANAMGGAIRILPRLPALGRTEGFLSTEALSIAHGGTGYGTSAMANLPLLHGTVALRGVAYYRAKQGFIDTEPLAAADFNDDRTGGARLTGLYEPSDALTVTARFAHQNRRSDGGPTEAAHTDVPTRSQIYRFEPNHDQWSLGSVTLDGEPGRVRVVSTTSYLSREPYHTRDFTPFVEQWYGERVISMMHAVESSRELSQELRVQSNADGNLQWLAGLFLQQQNTGFRQDLVAPGFDAATAGEVATSGLPDNLLHLVNVATIRNGAVFGDVSYRLSPRWEAGAGVRVYRVTQDYATRAVGELSGDRNESGSAGESGLTPRASVQFQPSPAISLYGNVAKGFRPGGANWVSAACQQAQLAAGLGEAPPTFRSDTLWSYEVGAKTSWLGQRLHASGAVFHIDWDEIQTQRVATPAVCSPTDNSGRARADGVELTVTAQPLRQLELEFAQAYTDARFAEDSPAARRRDGDPIPDVPRSTFAFAATYALPQPASFVRIDYQRRGAAPNDLAGLGSDEIESYEQVHARMVWRFARLEAMLAIRNLTNERGAFSRVAFPGGPFEIRVPPRTVTVGLHYPF